MSCLARLLENDVPVCLGGYSALDSYFRTPATPVASLLAKADLIECARAIPDLTFPGIEGADAVVHEEGRVVYIQCVDSFASEPRHPVHVLNLVYSPVTGTYLDPHGIYPHLRADTIGGDGEIAATEAAVLAARYHYRPPAPLPQWDQNRRLQSFQQRDLLSLVITGKNPRAGLEALMRSGFVDAHWPELAGMRSVGHAKEYHPEGDVWDHTLETFQYRKSTDLTLSLALLLHDVGKPDAQPKEGRHFDQHADLGTVIAGDFLSRLGFPEAVVKDVLFLVRQHMLPGLIKTLPVHRTEHVMASALFPTLLEVYRCDLSSTFRGPGGYYEACKVYRSFLRHRVNPFRNSDGSVKASRRRRGGR